ncbi:ankyrin repeat-containing domain protein [Baffinella frigidus]|nr:ankyrin repeat-containing domain protein [Cryptophyta sp. CCMP2293]
MIIKKQGELDRVDKNGRTPLASAVRSGHAEVVRTLVASGADANRADSAGWTPLAFAARDANLEIAR